MDHVSSATVCGYGPLRVNRCRGSLPGLAVGEPSKLVRRTRGPLPLEDHHRAGLDRHEAAGVDDAPLAGDRCRCPAVAARRCRRPRPRTGRCSQNAQRLPPRVGDDVEAVDRTTPASAASGEVDRSVGAVELTASPHQSGCDSAGWRWRRASSSARRSARGRRTRPPAPSRPTTSRCPGCRRCCCRPGCGRTRRPSPTIGIAVRHGQQAPRVAQLAAAQREHLARARSSSPSQPQFHERLSPEPSGWRCAVGLVVLAVVGDEVVQREPVVAGEEVDALERGVEQVGAALHPLHHRRHQPGSARRKPRPSSRKRSFHCRQPRRRPRPSRAGGRRRRPTARRPSRRRVVGPRRRSLATKPTSWAQHARRGRSGSRRRRGRRSGRATSSTRSWATRRRGVEVVAAAASSRCSEPSAPEAVERARRRAHASCTSGRGLVDLGRVVEHDVEPHLDVARRGRRRRTPPARRPGRRRRRTGRCTAPKASGM